MKSLTKFKSFPSWFWIGVLLGIVAWFAFPLAEGKIPIPADTILGMYHPWRDQAWDGLTRVPFKNFLITDPVQQQFPWKELAVGLVKQGKLPLWNPYAFSGTPLLANFQAGSFYPLNLLFFLLPMKAAWAAFILCQSILGGIFLYGYLRFFRLRKPACFLGSLAWVFSGFFIAWWEWGNIGHTLVWLPLILLAVEKIFSGHNWGLVFLFGLGVQFLAGHPQTAFYVFLVSLAYVIGKLALVKEKRRGKVLVFLFHYLVFGLLTAVQWLPGLELILHSARTFDQPDWGAPNWFLPWKHLVQFIAPDFFGNPATLNYWGGWNYGEFVGYLGLVPLIFACLAFFWRRDKKTIFFSLLVLGGLIFALPTPLAKLPYQLKIPFLFTSRPTRLMAVIDFSLAVLAALGLDWILGLVAKDQFFKTGGVQKTGGVILIVGFLLGGLWGLVLAASRFWPQATWLVNLAVSKRNLILPTALFSLAVVTGGTLVWFLKSKPQKRSLGFALSGLFFIGVAFDLLRFGRKFTPFVKSDWLFPPTEVTQFLRAEADVFRLMTVDRRIFPPNFSSVYRLQTVEGYDPLYLKRYGQLIAAWERKEPDISPFSFNRILRPGGVESRLADLLNVKYVLSLTDLKSEKLELAFQEGETRVYRNKEVFPRAFWVPMAVRAETDQEAVNLLFDPEIDLRKTVVLENNGKETGIGTTGKGKAEIEDYQENRVALATEADQEGWVVLTDSFYPGWQAEIDGETKEVLRSNFAFRAVRVSEGKHRIIFSYQPKAFKIGLVLSLGGIILLAVGEAWGKKSFLKIDYQKRK